MALLLPCVASRFFNYNSAGDDGVILLDVDFSVKLTAKYHGHVVAEKVFTADDVMDAFGSSDTAF